jgi:uncharacterized protein YbjT (DUF2867 family)
MSIRVVTVFGGTGFLGRRVVRHLREHKFSVRIASRHPDRSRKLLGSDDPCVQSVEADIRDERMAADVLAGTHAAVNAVSQSSAPAMPGGGMGAWIINRHRASATGKSAADAITEPTVVQQ